MNTYSATITNAYNDVLGRVVRFLPEIVVALITLIIGLIVASLIRAAVDRILHYTRFRELSEKMGLKNAEEQTGQKIDIANFIAGLAYWFVLLVFIDAAFGIIHVSAFNQFVNAIFAYIPNIIAALIILVIGFVGSTFLGDIITGLASISHVGYRNILAGVVKWIVIIVAVMAALQQLNIATTIINILFTGLVTALAIGTGLAIGLAFGLGGKDTASRSLAMLTSAMNNMAQRPPQGNNQNQNRQQKQRR